MPPSRSAHERLADVVSAAVRVFSAKGYRRTQMADVAAELGVSAGNLYNYVEGKDALFHACLRAVTPGAEPTAGPLPLPNPPPGAHAEVARIGIKALGARGPLAEALKVDDPEDVAAELAAIIGDFYDRTSASREFQVLVERSAPDLPELHELFFAQTRRPALAALTMYLGKRIASGHLRQVPDVATTARLVNETQAWFARHRHRNLDASDVIDDAAARATVIDVLVAGLLPR